MSTMITSLIQEKHLGISYDSSCNSQSLLLPIENIGQGRMPESVTNPPSEGHHVCTHQIAAQCADSDT
eukprot:1514024-Amphidinium_carterae.1